ncbi:DUF937 domain-containing protein [Acidobacteriota bacterium]
MASFIEELMESFGPEVNRSLSANMGLDQKTVGQVIPAIAPLILGGLKRQMETRGGADRADHILNKYGSADVLNRIDDEIATRSRDENPDPRLGGLLGDSGVQAADTISKQFKIDPSIAMKLIPVLAPIILGALSNKRDKDGLGSNGIASLIDQDGDGQILDDVAGFLMQGLSSSGSGQGGGLLGMLGGLFSKRK